MAWKRGRNGFSKSSLYNCRKRVMIGHSHVEVAALSITSRVEIFEKNWPISRPHKRIDGYLTVPSIVQYNDISLSLGHTCRT